jgi:hypothetical protein
MSSLACRTDSLFCCEHTSGLPILRHHRNGKAERWEKKSKATSWRDANHLKALSMEEIQYPDRGLSIRSASSKSNVPATFVTTSGIALHVASQ